MNSRLIIPLSLLALMSVLGCKKQPSADPIGGELKFNVEIAGATTKASKTAFTVGDTLGLWVVPYIKTDPNNVVANDVRGTLRATGNYFDNVYYKMSAGSVFTPAEMMYYPSPFVKVDLYAVSPYDKLMSDKVKNSMSDPTKYAFAVKSNQSHKDSVVKSDLMTTLFYGTKSGQTPALIFRHRLAKVNVNVTVPKTFQGYKVLALKSVEVMGTKLKATVNLTDTLTTKPAVKPALVTGDTVATIKALQLTAPTGSPAPIDGLYTWEAIVIPQDIAVSSTVLRIVLTLDKIGDMPLLSNTATALEYVQYKQTAFNVTIEDKGSLIFGTPTIHPWGSTADVQVDGRRAARMIFGTTNGDAAVAALGIQTANLSIDDTTYVSSVEFQGEKLICTYMEPKQRKGDKLRAVVFKKGTTTVPFSSLNPAIPTTPVAGLNIPGDPTSFDYTRVISTVTFN